MGSCASTLDCSVCHWEDRHTRAACAEEIEVNPDIAGIGVMISFYFSALVLVGVILWGYWKQSLPSHLLSPVDHHFLSYLRRRKSFPTHRQSTCEVSARQHKVIETVTGFLKIVGDQQLVTGLAVLIAGIASRCETSIYEFNIVTNLAYFAIYNQLLSLHILRKYHRKHNWIRLGRVIITIISFVLVSFAYVINTVSSQNDLGFDFPLYPAHALQCIFIAAHDPEYPVTFDVSGSVLAIGILAHLHVMVICDLYSSVAAWMERPFISDTWPVFPRNSSLSKTERRDVIHIAKARYSAWIRPTRIGNADAKTSIWYFLEAFDRTYLGDISAMFLGLSYGTANIVSAIWEQAITPSNGLRVLSFGQIVALGLLVLTFIAAVQIFNEQQVAGLDISATTATIDDGASSVEDHSGQPIELTAASIAVVAETSQYVSTNKITMFLVRLWIPKTLEDLRATTCAPVDLITPNNCDNDLLVLKNTSRFLLITWPVHFSLCVLYGIGFSSLSTGNLFPFCLGLVGVYLLFRCLFDLHTYINLAYFIRAELHSRKSLLRHSTSSSQHLLATTTVQASPMSSMDITRTSTAASSPELGPDTVVQDRVVLARDNSDFGTPRRADTEHDLGLFTFSRRKTYEGETI